MDMQFWSEDRLFGLVIPCQVLRQLLSLCAEAVPRETGGILVGYYTDSLECAIVTAASGPPVDSRSGKTWFVRGIQGLHAWLHRLWRRREYYLGEWHLHRSGTSEPSGADIIQMRQNSQSPEYKCPEAVLLILGGDPCRHDELSAFGVSCAWAPYPIGCDNTGPIQGQQGGKGPTKPCRWASNVAAIGAREGRLIRIGLVCHSSAVSPMQSTSGLI